ncbi:MAG: hypothetical protein ACW98F_06770 [Candidatus Hodarchaeales archaeon]|jgi:hypothetical protein
MKNNSDLNPVTDEPNIQKDERTLRNKIQNHMSNTLKEMFNGLRHPEFKFAPSGIIITVVLSIFSLFFFLGPYLFTSG